MNIPNEGEWSFNNENIAKNFNNHVKEQLPWYDMATDIVCHFVKHYLPNDGLLYDVGASTGNITKNLTELIKNRNIKAVSIEPSKEMIANFTGCGEVENKKAENYAFEDFDVCVMFLTMMFIPVSKRDDLIKNIRSKLKKGGVIIIFDKREPVGGYISTVLYRLTLSSKLKSGASPDDIMKKELSLSGCQIPYTCKEADAIEVFRFGDFSGWIIEGK